MLKLNEILVISRLNSYLLHGGNEEHSQSNEMQKSHEHQQVRHFKFPVKEIWNIEIFGTIVYNISLNMFSKGIIDSNGTRDHLRSAWLLESHRNSVLRSLPVLPENTNGKSEQPNIEFSVLRKPAVQNRVPRSSL